MNVRIHVCSQCSNCAARCAAAPLVFFAAPLSFLKQTALHAAIFFDLSVGTGGNFEHYCLKDHCSYDSNHYQCIIRKSFNFLYCCGINTYAVLIVYKLFDVGLFVNGDVLFGLVCFGVGFLSLFQ